MAARSKPKATPAGANGSPPTPEVLTLAEAAAWLRVPEDGLRRDAEAGRIPARRVATEWRFVKEALLEWLSKPAPAETPKSSKEQMRAPSGPGKTTRRSTKWSRTFTASGKRTPWAGSDR